MVARLTVNKKKYEPVKDRMWQIIDQAETLRTALTRAVEQDAVAFDAILAAFKLPRIPRTGNCPQPCRGAGNIPCRPGSPEAARLAVSVMELAVEAAELGNLNAISDAGSAWHYPGLH